MRNVKWNWLGILTLFTLALCLAPIASATYICGDITWTVLVDDEGQICGKVAVGNDADTLYVGVMPAPGCLLKVVQTAIVRDIETFPEELTDDLGEGNSYALLVHDPPVPWALYSVPLEVLNFEVGDEICLALIAHLICDNGTVEKACRAHGVIYPGTWCIPIFCHEVQRCGGCFRTQTQGGWGAPPNGNNPGAYLHANFADAFPSGVTIGGGSCDGDSLTFSSAQEITDFLPAGGPPHDLLGGVLAGQVLALSLSVGFDAYDPGFGSSALNLADLVVVDPTSPCFGMTVAEVLEEANDVLAGCESDFTPSEINDCVTAINQNFVDGAQNNGYLGLP